MEQAGYWTTGITALLAAVTGWAWGLGRRRLAYVTFGVALFLWVNAWSFFIENCGGGGDCHRYADWDESKAALVAGVPPLLAGSCALLATLALRTRRGTSRKALLLPDSHLPEHESMRRMIANAHGRAYRSYESLEEAKQDEDAVAILQGDDGGQVYVVIPVERIGCSARTLEQLLKDLDAIAWPGNDADMKGIYFERQPRGSGIAGGMGGAVVRDLVWIHEEFREMGLAEDIQQVIAGALDHIRTSDRDRDLP